MMSSSTHELMNVFEDCMDRVVTFAMSEDLIAATADYILASRTGSDLSRIAVVFPSKRPSLFLRRALAVKLKRTFFPPRFFSMDEFMGETAKRSGDPAPVPDMDSAYILYRLSGALAPEILKGRERFSQFLPWAMEILGFIDHCDREDVAGSLLENVQRNAEIGYDVPESINRMLRHVRVIRDAFHEELERGGKCTRGMVYRHATGKIDGVRFKEYDTIVFCNLFFLHATETAVVKKLYERGDASLLFQGDERDWPVLRRLGKQLGISIQPRTDALPRYELKLYAGYDTHSQAEIVREIVRTFPDPEQGALVLPDPEAALPLLSGIAPAVDAVNVSLGYPLTRSSLFSLIEMVFKAQSTRREEEYYTRDYLRLISHPLVKNLRLPGDPAITRVIVHKIEETLAGGVESPLGGALFILPGGLCGDEMIEKGARETLIKMDIALKPGEVKRVIESLHALVLAPWERVTTFAGFARAAEGFLDTLVSRSFLTSYPLNVRAVERLFAFMEELAASSFARETFDRDEIFRVIAQRLENEMISFSGSPLRGFQVLGLLESRSLSFDRVIVMDVNESALPRLSLREPLIPRDVMLGIGLDRVAAEEEIQRYHFRRLIAASSETHLVYADDRQKEKSRFIEELLWERQKKSGALEIVPVTMARFPVTPAPEKSPLPKGEAAAAWLRRMTYSATAVNTYLECPARFYYRYVAGLREKESVGDGPEGADLGVFMHNFLYGAFQCFVGARPVIDDEFTSFFFSRLEKSFDEQFAVKMRSGSFLVREIVDFRLRRFLEKEKERGVKEIVCLERKFTGEFPAAGHRFKFEARVDRIDRMDDGGYLVIDYKTGSVSAMPAKSKTLQAMVMDRASIKKNVGSFQLPLYLYLAVQSCGAAGDAALYDLRAAELAHYYSEPEPETRTIKDERCRIALEAILAEIAEPSIPFIPDDEDRDRCRRCPYFYACR